VGRLERSKGIVELMDAFERVRARVPGALLVLAGDGEAMRETTARAAGWGGDTAARVLGPIPHEDVARWMGACDLLTLPSVAEGTPNVVLEALASGRPVVATSVGGIPDVLADERTGLLVPPRDASALADALVAALHASWDEDAVRACGPRSWAESARALREVLESVRESPAPAPSARPVRARSSVSRTPARTTPGS
jgi:glycosyltransferase involved in cell wall biosynthesis